MQGVPRSSSNASRQSDSTDGPSQPLNPVATRGGVASARTLEVGQTQSAPDDFVHGNLMFSNSISPHPFDLTVVPVPQTALPEDLCMVSKGVKQDGMPRWNAILCAELSGNS